MHALFFDRLDSRLRDPAPVIRPYLPGTQDPDDLLLRVDLTDELARYAADPRAGRALGGAHTGRVGADCRLLDAYRIEKLLLRPDWAADAAGN